MLAPSETVMETTSDVALRLLARISGCQHGENAVVATEQQIGTSQNCDMFALALG